MKKNIVIVAILLHFFSVNVFSEGTKELSPLEANLTGIAIIPGISSGSYLNCSEDNRIYFRINDFNTERFYLGLRPHFYLGIPGKPDNTWCADSVFVRIYNPTGTVVYQQKLDTTAGMAGFINTYAQGAAGPNIGGATPAGYNPITFTPTVNGAFWIELYYSLDNGATMLPTSSNNYNWLKFPYFDFTVATAANVKFPGRVYSDKWSFVAMSNAAGLCGTYNFGRRFTPTASASSEAVLFTYTADSVVLRTDFEPGFKPIAFNFAVNNYGVASTGNWLVDRRSVNSSSTPLLANGYKNFLNDPDILLFPSGIIPSTPTFPEPTIRGCPPSGPYRLRYKLPAPADVVILLDINGIAGYQPSTSDRIIEHPTRNTGLNTYIWDGLDGTGTAVPAGATINFSISVYFQKGKASIPLYDAELNSAGFKVSGIRPVVTPALRMYWDDSQLTNVGSCPTNDGSLNVTGTGFNNSIVGSQSPAHAWNGTGNLLNVLPAPNATHCSSATTNDDNLNINQWDDFGNVRIINTWAYGVENFITKSIKLVCISISGTVYNDVNGSANNTFSNILTAGEVGTNGGTLYAAALDPETNEVIGYSAVNTNGTYTINGVPVNSNGLKVILTTTLPVLDNVAPSESVPAGWHKTTPTLNSFNTLETSLTGFDFGINRLPESAVNLQAALNNPGGADNITVPANAFNISNVGANSNTLDYDGGTVNNIRITSFPSNATSITIGTTTYYPNAAAIPGTCPTATCLVWPTTGVTVPFTPGIGTTQDIKIDPLDGVVTVLIPFVAVDNAGNEDPTPGSVTLSFTTVLNNRYLFFEVAKNSNGSAQIKFTITQATPNSKYFIQKSIDGINFSTISTIHANNELNFEAIDNNLSLNRKNYYRIKYVSALNEVDYSQVKFIFYEKKNSVLTYPKPTSEYLNINFDQSVIGKQVSIRLYNDIGKLVSLQQLSRANANEKIKTVGLANGSYSLIIQNNSEVIYHETIIIIK